MSLRTRKRGLDQSPEHEGTIFLPLNFNIKNICKGRRPFKRPRSAGNFRSDEIQEQEPSDETKLEMLIEKVGEKVLTYYMTHQVMLFCSFEEYCYVREKSGNTG